MPEQPVRGPDPEASLLFLLGAPRSGTTLLMRVLHATSSVHGMPEAHLLPPLAHLGPWRAVDRAPYDALQAQAAQRDLLARLPEGEAAWYDAARAYCDHLYGRLLAEEARDRRYLLDKTPANALVLPVLTRLYPEARYLVLTRHPAAIACSYAESFFSGDHRAARRFNPVLERYVPPLAALLRDPPRHLLHVQYEALVREPEATLARVCAFLEIPFEPQAVRYGSRAVAPGLGDPTGVPRHDRPVADGVNRWAEVLARDPVARDAVVAQVEALDPRDLATWGYPPEMLWAALEAVDPAGRAPRRRRAGRFALERRLLLALRRDIDRRPHGRAVRRLRDWCEILLRGS